MPFIDVECLLRAKCTFLLEEYKQNDKSTSWGISA